MKRKGLLILTTIIVSAVFLSIYTIAKQPSNWEYYAYGHITNYQEAYSAEIKSGFWNLKVLGKEVWLNIYYLEKNLDSDVENSPEDSTDMFEMSVNGKPFFIYEDVGLGKLYVFAKFQVKKTWATFDGTYEPKTWHTYRMLIIDFNEPRVLFDGYPPDSFSDPPPGSEPEPPVDPDEPWTYDWDIEGTLEGYNYPPF
jgi:hypothetical protein